MIITDASEINRSNILCMTSLGGSPFHLGHLSLLKDCKRAIHRFYESWRQGDEYIAPLEVVEKNVSLLVVINCNSFLERKRGFCFQDENVRAEFIDSMKMVDYVFIHHSDEQTITSAISMFQPNFLCKGGDRANKSCLPSSEVEACENVGCEILFGVGGTEKVESSSNLLKRAANHYFYHKPYLEWLEDENKYQYKDLMENAKNWPKETLSQRIQWLDDCNDRLSDGKFY